MDGDFQQRYQAAEQAYGEGRYTDADTLATTLLQQLEATPDTPENRAAKLGWRAIVGLLLGHITLYGQQQPDPAAGFYQLVLDSDPQETLAELARQGLNRCQAQQPGEAQRPDLLQDPFVNSGSAAAPSAQQQQARPTAMPWLDAPSPAEPEPEPSPTPTPSQEPLQAQESPAEAEQEETEQEEAETSDPEQVLSGALLRVRLDAMQEADPEQRADDSASASLLQRLRRQLRRSDRR
jgi:outer membrane biosynthesis protein TonB